MNTRKKIFVFGSNLAGRHGKGAALTARNEYGAIYGQGIGHQGDAYAIPTKDGRDRDIPLSDPSQTLSLPVIEGYVQEFIQYALNHPELTFEVARVGCGLAGYTDRQIAPLFKNAPVNCELPEGWRNMEQSQQFHWSRRDGYECSSKGDKRFSAFCAVMPDGRTIEQHYQCDVKGYDVGGTNWRLGKGKPALNGIVDLWGSYLNLWRVWAERNPALIEELREHAKKHQNTLSDCFARSMVNQARALATLLNEIPEQGNQLKPQTRTVGIIGTAGRDKTKPMGINLWNWMLRETAMRIVPAPDPDIIVVSGGAAWADHLAVILRRSGRVKHLRLHLPAPFVNGRFVGKAGEVANMYHEKFSLALGQDKNYTLNHIVDVLKMDGVEVTEEEAGKGFAGFFIRNAKVAQVDELYAFTFGEGDVPADGGTKDTWNKCLGKKTHISLPYL